MYCLLGSSSCEQSILQKSKSCKCDKISYWHCVHHNLFIVSNLDGDTTQLSCVENPPSPSPHIKPPAAKQVEFGLQELLVACNDKATSNLIGTGGYGSVYKGRLRHTSVAIKFLSKVLIVFLCKHLTQNILFIGRSYCHS